MAERFRCVLCRRDKFDEPYVPHRCNGGFRKRLPPFERVVEGEKPKRKVIYFKEVKDV